MNEKVPLIYVASKTSHAPMWRSLRDESDVPIISSWIDEAGPGETKDLSELWVRIVAEVKRSALLVCYAELDDFPLKGALVEVGIALGCNTPIVVSFPRVDIDLANFRPVGSWVNHPLVKYAPDIKKYLKTGMKVK